MIPDPSDLNRVKLRDNPYSFISKVDTPFQDYPDLEEINQATFERVCFVLKQFERHSPQEPAPSEGIVLLGEAGSGKTHLLMRVAKRLSKANYVLFVPKPNNEEAVYLHTWTNIVQSLAEILPARSRTRSQLDDLLAHVFSAVLVPEFEKGGDQQRRWARRLKDDPLQLFGMLGEGQQRETNFRKIRAYTLKCLKRKHPAINETITHALITYVLAAGDRTRRIILTWLAGQGGIDEKEAKSLGLPIQWVDVSEESSQANYLRQREDQAFAAIKTLGILSTYYQPLILAYDQLEGLRTRESLTRRWSEAVREIINYAPNYLVLTCVFPSLWDDWARSTWIETSSADRVGPRKFTLDRLKPEHALKLLEGQTGPKARELSLPSLIYPFDEAEITAICSNVKTPREFLLAARERFEEWLFQRDPPPAPMPVSADSVLKFELDRLAKQAYETLEHRVPHEEDLFGRVRHIIEVLLQDFMPRFRKAELGSRVMPFNIVVLPFGMPGLCLSILNSSGNSLTARLRNLNEVARQREVFGTAIILRDKRCGAPRSGTIGKDILVELEREGSIYIEAERKELAQLHAIYDAIVAIEQEDLRVGSRLITEGDLIRYLQNSGYLRSCPLFVRAAEQSQLFRELVHGDTQGQETIVRN